jgi:heme/copper-type cytochrome/quinol oxidase subunit 1
MASTGGGFLLGFGLCLLVFSLLLSVVIREAYSELEKYRSDIETLYSITHSSEYQLALNGLETISPYASSIRDALCHPLISWMGLCGIGQGLESSISSAASMMREVQLLSERLYTAMIVLPAVESILWAASMVGLIMMAIGIALIIRARRKQETNLPHIFKRIFKTEVMR